MPNAGAGGREQQRFRQELADDAAAAGAEREPKGDLAPAGGAARQEQVRDVRARGGENQADEPHQHAQRPGVPASRVVLPLRAGIGGKRRIVRHLRRDLVERRAGEPPFARGLLKDRLERRGGLRRRDCPARAAP